jgi:hypothetical protein
VAFATAAVVSCTVGVLARSSWWSRSSSWDATPVPLA